MLSDAHYDVYCVVFLTGNLPSARNRPGIQVALLTGFLASSFPCHRS